MADFYPFPRASSPAQARPPEEGAIALPVLIGCASRCGKVTAINWPQEPDLRDVSAQLREHGWVLATAEVAGLLSIVGVSHHAMAPLCGDCARGEQARQHLASNRVPTLRRPR